MGEPVETCKDPPPQMTIVTGREGECVLTFGDKLPTQRELITAYLRFLEDLPLNRSERAEIMGVASSTYYEMLSRYGLREPGTPRTYGLPRKRP